MKEILAQIVMWSILITLLSFGVYLCWVIVTGIWNNNLPGRPKMPEDWVKANPELARMSFFDMISPVVDVAAEVLAFTAGFAVGWQGGNKLMEKDNDKK